MLWTLLMLLSFQVEPLKTSSELFSSMSEMQKLYDNEKLLTQALSGQIEAIDSQLKILDDFLDTHYKDYNYTEQDAVEYVSHPFNTFSLIKRTALEWPKVKEALFGTETLKLLQDFQQVVNSQNVTDEDMLGALEGILLLSYTYDFNLTELAEGRIQIPKAQAIERGLKEHDYIQDSPIQVQELLMMGQLAFNKHRYDWSIRFLKVALEAARKRGQTEFLSRIKSVLKTVSEKHDQVLIKGAIKEGMTTFGKLMDPKLAKKVGKKVKMPKKKKLKLYQPLIDLDQINEMFAKTCRGAAARPAKDDQDKYCKWLHYHNPYLRLGPLKLEELNFQPFVGLFRDFMSDAEINAFKDKALNSGRMSRSRHSATKAGEESYGHSSSSRTSQQVWIEDTLEDHDMYLAEASKVSRRIQLATWMEPRAFIGGEMFQVANYGLGGQYSRHFDAVGEGGPQDPDWEPYGDRLQTFMAYLSDVEAGGATAFPQLGLAVWPTKGDAITWYNLHRNGYQDKLTAHGGCPVIKGSKWITNKWIRLYPQALTMPCPLNDNDFWARPKPFSNHVSSFLPTKIQI